MTKPNLVVRQTNSFEGGGDRRMYWLPLFERLIYSIHDNRLLPYRSAVILITPTAHPFWLASKPRATRQTQVWLVSMLYGSLTYADIQQTLPFPATCGYETLCWLQPLSGSLNLLISVILVLYTVIAMVKRFKDCERSHSSEKHTMIILGHLAKKFTQKYIIYMYWMTIYNYREK